MFRWIGRLRNPKQKFADGSRIRPLNRESYEYTEPDGHAMTVEAPMTGAGPIDIILVEESFARWRPPHDVEPISQERRREIVEKFKRYLDDRRIAYRIE